MYDLISLVLYSSTALICLYGGVKLFFKVKTKLKKREFEVSANAFKGFVRDQRTKANYWGMVKAYRERVIHKLGWDKE